MKKFKNRKIVIGLTLFSIFVFVSLLGPIFNPTDPYAMTVSSRLQSPSFSHPFGTDEHGRDLFVRILYGGRISLMIGFLVTGISLILGSIIGLYATTNHLLDNLFMRICDGLMAIPAMLLAIALMSVFGASARNVILALTIVYTPMTARMVRAMALKIRELLFIDAIKLQGASHSRILWKHIFPNILGTLSVQGSYIFASSIISEASLSFLGAGVPAPDPSWGSIIQAGKGVIFQSSWIVLIPSTALLLSVLSLNILGDGIRDALDPTFKEKISRQRDQKLYQKAVNKLKMEQLQE